MQRSKPAAEGAETLFEGSALEPVMQEEVGVVQQHSIAPIPLTQLQRPFLHHTCAVLLTELLAAV